MRTTTSTSRGPSSSQRFPTPRDPETPQAPLEELEDEEGGFFEEANTATDNILTLPREEHAPAASLTAHHVGTQQPRASEPEIRLGKACLRESIAVPQYFQGSKEPLYDTSAHILSNEPPHPRDNSIWIDKLSRS